MGDKGSMKDRWPRRRNITIVMMVICAALLGLIIVQGNWNGDTVFISVSLSIGIVLGILYLRRRGRLPEWILFLARMQSELPFQGSPNIVADDEPGNISPKVYLPLIIGALVIGAVLIWIFN